MRFRRIDYLGWAKRTHDVAPVRYDLSISAVRHVPPGLLGPLDDVPLTGNNAYGHPGVRASLAARYGVPGERVLCSVAGTSAANFMCAAALVQPGDAVLVEWPCYEPIWRIFEALGARIEWLDRPPERRCALDLARIEQALIRGARVVAISNPMNPTGLLAPRADVLEAGRLAARHGAHVIVDEIYLDAFEGPEAVSAARGTDGAPAPGIVVTASLTKAYGLGPQRIGWVLGPPKVIDAAMDAIVASVGVLPIAWMHRSALALSHVGALSARSRSLLGKKRERVARWMREQENLAWSAPSAGLFGFATLRRSAADLRPVIERGIEAHGVIVAPGSFFGVPNGFRLAWSLPEEQLDEALLRLGNVLATATS